MINIEVNVLFALITSLIFVYQIKLDKWILLRPSVMVALFFHIFIQWPLVLDTEHVNGFLPNPVEMYMIAHGFPVVIIYLSKFVFPRGHALFVEKIKSIPIELTPDYRHILLLSGAFSTIAAWYILTVGLTNTGLWAIMFDPTVSAVTRERSLKLLDDPALQYAFTIACETIAPILVALLVAKISAMRVDFYVWKYIPWFTAILMVALVVSLTGARSSVSFLLLGGLSGLLLRNGFKINKIALILVLLLMMLIPTLLTLFREGNEFSIEGMIGYFGHVLSNRIFYVPSQISTWYVHHAQTTGGFGIGGMGHAAILLGYSVVDTTNIIGRIYAEEALDSICANGCFVFSYYNYFGNACFPLVIMCTLILDLVILVYLRLPYVLAMAAMGVSWAGSMSFINADWTTCAISHGYLLVPLTAWSLNWVTNSLFFHKSRECNIVALQTH